MPPEPVKAKNGWCEIIDDRCSAIARTIAKKSGHKTDDAKKVDDRADRVCGNNPSEELESLCKRRDSCQLVSGKCEKSPPVTPFVNDRTELMESQRYHDVHGFYEISDTLISKYLPAPSINGGKLKILYPCAGMHIAPFETAFQILEKTDYNDIEMTYTDIDETYFKDLCEGLSHLKNSGLNFSLKPGKEDATHKERVLECTYKTRSGKEKHIKLNFVIGKKNSKGGYPPYFRQTDFNEADAVVVFDAEDAEAAIKHLDSATELNRGKTMIIENRPEYKKWAKENGSNITGNFSQHFGCEVPRPKLRPIIFRLK